MPQTDHMTRLALTAADWALADAGIDTTELPEYGIGVVTAASGGAVEFGQRELQNLWSKGKEYVSAYQSFAWFYAVNTGQISIRHKLRGPSGVLLTEQAGGIDALGHARRHIRKGFPAVISGGIDAAICPWGWVPQIASGLMSTVNDPARAYLPFSEEAAWIRTRRGRSDPPRRGRRVGPRPRCRHGLRGDRRIRGDPRPCPRNGQTARFAQGRRERPGRRRDHRRRHRRRLRRRRRLYPSSTGPRPRPSPRSSVRTGSPSPHPRP